jgi:hypothetical protein
MPPSCKQPGCPIVATGKCLEGFDPPTKCPNYLAEGVATAPTPATPGQAAARVLEGIELPAGTAFDPGSAYEVTREGIARVVILAGAERSGKTTLLASLYELFQEGPVGRFSFAGSQTLPALELRCHEARAASGRTVADTERTKPAEGFRFLHLALLDTSAGARRNLLLGDMSGELYDSLRDSHDECRKYEFLRRADHFVAMLNAAKLSEGHHAEAYAHARGLVRALLDADVLRRHSHVTLLTTKWDLIAGPDGEKARERVLELERHFEETFAARLPNLHFAHVAARPATRAVDFAYGVKPLLQDWLDTGGLPPPPKLDTVPSEREFDRLVTIGAAKPSRAP